VNQRQRRLQENYDWIVLGDTPAALLCAALVARMGLSVLIVSEDSGKKWELAQAGQLVDLEPNFLMGLARMDRLGGMVAECLSRMRFPAVDWEQLIRHEYLFQAITPRFRASFAHQTELFERELKRETGDYAQSWTALSQALSVTEILSHGFWRYLPERLSLRDPKHQALPMEVPLSEELLRAKVQGMVSNSDATVRGWFAQSPNLNEVLRREGDLEWMQAWLVGALGKELQAVSPYQALQVLSLARTGSRVRGGVSSLRQALLRLAIRLGAQVETPDGHGRRIFIEEGKILGVQLGQRSSVIRTSGIAAGCSTALARSWVDGEETARLEAHEGLRVTLALSVRKKGIPAGMLERAVWKENGAPALEMERAFPEEYGLPGLDHESIFLRSVFPLEAVDWTASRWRSVLERMYRQACEVVPFLEENEFRRFPDFRASDFEDQWSRYFGTGPLSPRWELMRVPLRRPDKSKQLSVEGLFVLDGANRPEWGSLGEFADALDATSWMAHRSGLAGPLG